MDNKADMKTAIVIGATSGIGRGLAKVLSENGYRVCATGRRVELLETLGAELPNPSICRRMDVCNTDEAIRIFNDIVSEMGHIDLVVINAGVGWLNAELSLQKEQETIATNVSGFCAMANTAYHLFVRQGAGHIVGISSIAALRGGPAVAYNASKAFVSSYLDGLRFLAAKAKLPIVITDIRPGFVDTAMAQGEQVFWVQPVSKAAGQIFRAIRKRKKRAYITKRWRLIAWILKVLPDWIYHTL